MAGTHAGPALMHDGLGWMAAEERLVLLAQLRRRLESAVSVEVEPMPAVQCTGDVPRLGVERLRVAAVTLGCACIEDAVAARGKRLEQRFGVDGPHWRGAGRLDRNDARLRRGGRKLEARLAPGVETAVEY